jgi:hypothetical protein
MFSAGGTTLFVLLNLLLAPVLISLATALLLLPYISLISSAVLMCYDVMPECYTSKDRKVVVSVGIFLAVASIIFQIGYLILEIFGLRRYGDDGDIQKVYLIGEIVLMVAIYSYLIWASIKIHSKILYAAIAIALVINIIGIKFISFYGFFLAFLIILISLIYLKNNGGDYSVPDEIEEYEPLKYCSQCGKPVEADEDFCTNCGAKVE